MTEPTPSDWLAMPVRIESGGVYFGDTKLPGCIAQDGITLHPGGGADINRLVVEFYVGEVIAPLAPQKSFDINGMKVADK